MDSPYRPGFGTRPAVLAGREQHLARAGVALTRVANSGGPAPSALVLTGARGVGKTVTLGAISEAAVARGFLTVAVTFDSVSDNVQLLAGRLAEAIAPLEDRSGELWAGFRQRLASLAVEVNAGVVKISSAGAAAPTRGRGEGDGVGTTVARQVLADLLAHAARIGAAHDRTGLVVLLDELQEAPRPQLVVVANAIQDVIAAGIVPLAVFAAGLPHTPEAVMAAASFTERFDFRVLDPLDPGSAERALLEPALALRVSWEPVAVDAVLQAAGGSPYLIQRLGDEAWLLADPAPGGVVGATQAEAAVAEVRRSLGAGMFRGRWAKATPAERAYLVAVAQVVDPDGVAGTRHLTALIGRTTSQLSPVRKSLLDKGLIEAVGHGRVRFTMPGFAEFVRSQVDAPWYGAALHVGTITVEQLRNPRPIGALPGAGAPALGQSRDVDPSRAVPDADPDVARDPVDEIGVPPETGTAQ